VTSSTSSANRPTSGRAVSALRASLSTSPWVIAVWVAAGLYALVFSVASVRGHIRFETAFDTAIVDQTVWLLANFHEPFTTVDSRPFLGGHFEPGLVLLVPLYWLGLDVGALLVLQSVALALTAPALFALARATGASPGLASIPALLWLVSPAVASANAGDFHLATLVPPLVVLSVLAALRDRHLLLAVTTVLALSLKEDVAVVYVVLGAIVFFRGSRRIGGALAVAAGLWAVLALASIRGLGDTDEFFAERFAGDRGNSIGEALGYMARHPVETLVDVADHSGTDLLVLLASTGGLAVLAPLFLLLGLPAALHNMLSDYVPQHTLVYHYHLPVVTACFVAAAVGVSRVSSFGRTGRRVVAVWVAGAVVIAVIWGASVGDEAESVTRAEQEAFEHALERIPADASVAASVRLLSHLSHRQELYTFPEPFVRIDWGGSLSDVELAERARRVRFVAVTGSDKPVEYTGEIAPIVDRLLERDFEVVESSPVGDLLILERRS